MYIETLTYTQVEISRIFYQGGNGRRLRHVTMSQVVRLRDLYAENRTLQIFVPSNNLCIFHLMYEVRGKSIHFKYIYKNPSKEHIIFISIIYFHVLH